MRVVGFDGDIKQSKVTTKLGEPLFDEIMAFTATISSVALALKVMKISDDGATGTPRMARKIIGIETKAMRNGIREDIRFKRRGCKRVDVKPQ